MKIHFLSTVLLLSLNATFAQAEETNQLAQKKYYATSFVGGLKFDNKRQLDDTFYYGVGAGYQFNQHWSAEVGALWFSTKYDGDKSQTKTKSDSGCEPKATGNHLKPVANPKPGNGLQACKMVEHCIAQPKICHDAGPEVTGKPTDNVICVAKADICVQEQVCEPILAAPAPKVEPDVGSSDESECDYSDDVLATIDEDVDVKGTQYYASVFYHFDPVGQWYPFVKGGLRHQELDFSNDRGHERETLMDVGLGVQRFLTKNLSARLTVSATHSLDNAATDLMTDVGLVYYFGEK